MQHVSCELSMCILQEGAVSVLSKGEEW